MKKAILGAIIISIMMTFVGCGKEEALYYSEIKNNGSINTVENDKEGLLDDMLAVNGVEIINEITPVEEFKYSDNTYRENLKGVVIRGYKGTSSRVVIPKEIDEKPVVMIENHAFKWSHIESIVLPETLKLIDEYAFSGCSNLADIRFSDELEEIGYGAFKDCVSIEEIVIPDNVTVIKASTFTGCENLKKVVLPANLEEIQEEAFSDCKELEQVIFTGPNTSITIDGHAFSRCRKLDESSKDAILSRNPELTWSDENGISGPKD